MPRRTLTGPNKSAQDVKVTDFHQEAHPRVVSLPSRNENGIMEILISGLEECKRRLDRVSRRSGTTQIVES